MGRINRRRPDRMVTVFRRGAPFSPDQLSNLALWLRADKGTWQDHAMSATPAAADGDVVGGWVDQSGNGNHVIQATTAKKPLLKLAGNGINSRAVIQFEGTDDILLGTINRTDASGLSVFAVVRQDDTNASNEHFLDGDSGADGERMWQFRYDSQTEISVIVFLDDVSTKKKVATLTPTNANLMSFVANATNVQIYLNSALQAPAVATGRSLDTGTAIPVALGARAADSDYFDGGIAEAVVIDGEISAADRALLDAYFNERYALW